MARNPLDRSAAFTALLELDPEGFGKSSDPEPRDHEDDHHVPGRLL